ncbi:MAG: hypothetical protein O2820_02700 [Planctomycetota bacterium]|nr:hypothetical protein [Planctomycetota bacterium]MDA1248111.1 hypothetical protein [Planctomycetota bacterium]
MQKRIALAVATLVLAVGQAGFAADKFATDKFPAELPPTVGLATFEDGTLILVERQRRYVEEEYTAKIPIIQIVDGWAVTTFRSETRTRRLPVNEMFCRKLKPESFFLFDLAGQKISESDFGVLLKTARTVLVSADGLPVAPFYRSIYKSDVLVVITKRLRPDRASEPGEIYPAPSPFRVPVRPAEFKAAPPLPESR